MRYVDGFVVPVPTAKLNAYWEMARIAAAVWKEHGALDYVECVAEDVKPGQYTSFPQSVDLQPDETVVFAWITYASRAERDRILAAVMEDPRLKSSQENMPFDGKRMIYGGFETRVEA